MDAPNGSLGKEALVIVGHELRNPIAALRNALLVLHQFGSDTSVRAWVEDIS